MILRHFFLSDDPALGLGRLRHDFIDYTMKCRSSSTVSLWLGQVLSFMVPARHTSALFISGFRLTTMRLLRRFRRAGCSSGPGGLLFGGRIAAPPGRHRPSRGLFGVYHDSVKLLGDNAVLPSLQLRVVQASVQDTSMCIISSEESSFPPGVAAAPGRLRSDIVAGSRWGGGGLRPGGCGCWTTQRGYHCHKSGCEDMLRRHVVASGFLSLCLHFLT